MEVKLKDLTKVFPSRDKKGNPVTAVENFELHIPDGQLVSLLGPSGCGKSTILNMISGLETPTSGQVFFGEKDVTMVSPEHRGIGLVFQDYALYPHLTVRGNIIFPLQNLKGKDKMTMKQMNEKALEVAKLVQIETLLDRKPKELSGGQQQRVAIARALVKSPDVLLLDEPLSNLDARLRLRTREEIRRIQRKTGITTIFVTHDQEEAMSISDFIVVMKEGVLQQQGKPQDVYDHPNNLFVAKFLGNPPINVFSGRIDNKVLYIGNDVIMRELNLEDQEVFVGIRPEGLKAKKDGVLNCRLSNVEVMGRDKSIYAENEAAENGSVRSIVESLSGVEFDDEKVSFSIEPEKMFIFNKQTQLRID